MTIREHMLEAERLWSAGEIEAGAAAVEAAVQLAAAAEAQGAYLPPQEARQLLEVLERIRMHLARERRALDARLAEAGTGRRARAAYGGSP
ncbi:MAG: hypothetical protein D6729_16465 [Deltaproteobacteria bacterium]|nr:MAG: hypothetical protein D6729_16465 [Deltaproteobacteria bacterium]